MPKAPINTPAAARTTTTDAIRRTGSTFFFSSSIFAPHVFWCPRPESLGQSVARTGATPTSIPSFMGAVGVPTNLTALSVLRSGMGLPRRSLYTSPISCHSRCCACFNTLSKSARLTLPTMAPLVCRRNSLASISSSESVDRILSGNNSIASRARCSTKKAGLKLPGRRRKPCCPALSTQKRIR